MSKALTCGRCGWEVPAGRTRCGRCGSAKLRAAVAGSEPLDVDRSRTFLIGGLAALALAVVGLLAFRSGSSVPVSAAPRASSTGGGRPIVEAGSTASTPAPGHAVVDASRRGAAAYGRGDFTTAVAEYTAAVEADPSDAAALNNLGQVLVRTGRAREAIPYFDRAVAAAGGTWSFHFNRARAYSELQEWRQAIAGYTEASRLFPDDYATQFNLARAKQADGDLPGAIESYARAVQLAPGEPDFQLWHGRALDLAGRRSEAAAAYGRYLEMQPEGPDADKVKARLSELNGKAGDAPQAAP